MEFFGRGKRLFAIIFTFVLADSALLLSVPYLTGRAIDAMSMGIGKVHSSKIQLLAALLLGVYLCDLLLSILNNFLMESGSHRIVRSMRKALFCKLQKMSISFFDTHTHGDLKSRFTNDIDNISTTISSSTVSLMNV